MHTNKSVKTEILTTGVWIDDQFNQSNYKIFTDAMGYRSPPFNMPLTGGSTSPGQGRSIREHDEQLNALRKENFNLKLRIYFMEEKNASANVPESSEAYLKENVDLKVR